LPSNVVSLECSELASMDYRRCCWRPCSCLARRQRQEGRCPRRPIVLGPSGL